LFCSDGKLDIVVPSFVHYLEVLEGSDGDKMPGTLLIFFLAGVLKFVEYLLTYPIL
jgi:hypothetical protein